MPPGAAPLIEREAQLANLLHALADPPCVVTVEGEPGVGKSRLVREVLADPVLAGRQVLMGHARRAAQPLGPVVEALADAELPTVNRLSPLSGALRAVLPELSERLPPSPAPLVNRKFVRHRLLRAAARLLGDLGPSILVLEDLHWADNDTLALVELLGNRASPKLSILLTFRPGESRSLRVLAGQLGSVVRDRIRLPPLSEQGTATLAAHLLGGPAVSDQTARLLHARSGGIPFPLREDVRLLSEHGRLRMVNGTWSLGDITLPALDPLVPEPVRAQVLSRAGLVSGASRRVLDTVAALGGPVDPDVLAAVAELPPDQTTAAMSELEACGLLRESPGRMPGPGFGYRLAQQAVYLAIPATRRRRLHARAAKTLSAIGSPTLAEDIANHYRRSGNLRAWVTAAEAAADLATERGDLATAYRQLRDVLPHVGGRGQGRIAVKLAWATLDRPGPEGVAVLNEALRQPGLSPGQRMEVRLLRTLAQFAQSGPDADPHALATELRQLTHALRDRPDLRAIGLAALAQPTRLPTVPLTTQLSDLFEARRALERTEDPIAHAAVLSTTVSMMLATGAADARRALDTLPATGRHIQVDLQVLRGFLAAAEAALALGHYARGRALAEEATALADRRGLRGSRPRLRAVRARLRWLMGDRQSQDELAEGFRLHGDLLMGQSLVERGRLDAGRGVLRGVADTACRTGELALAAHAVADLCRAGDDPAVDALAARVLERIAGKPNWVWAAPLLPFVNLDLVRRVLPAYRDGIRTRDAPLARAALSFAEARLCEADRDPAGARQGYRIARERYADLPDPRMAAHAASAEARCLTAEGRPADPEVLLQAWRTFHDLGAAWDADRLKQQIRRAGLPVPHRRGRPGYGNRLSPREREICHLAAAGHTNQNIADRLYLSERTVKYHLGNAMRKLGVTGRRELSEALSRRERPAAEERRDHRCVCVRCGRQINLYSADG